MSEETEENDHNLRSTVKFHNVETADNEEFPEREDDRSIIEAVISNEATTAPSEKIEPAPKQLTGVAALLANLNTDTEVSVIVKRLRDGQFKGQFRVPSDAESKLVETVAWDGELYPESIYKYIKKTYGGGRYRFQLQYGGGFKESWMETLNDPAELSELEKLTLKEKTKTDEQPRTVEVSLPFVNQPSPEKPDEFGDFLKKVEQFKQMQSLFAPPAAPAAPAPIVSDAPPPVTKETIKMALIEKALDNPSLLSKALEAVFDIPADKNPRPPGFWDSMAQTVQSSTEIQQMLLSGATTIVAPIITAIAAKLMPAPPDVPTTTAAAPLPVLRRPQGNTQTQPQTTAAAPTVEQLKPIETAPPAATAVPLIKLK